MTIDEILEAAEKATPGHYRAIGNGVYASTGQPCEQSIAIASDDGSPVYGRLEANTKLFAGAPQLAAEVRRLREREKVLTEALKDMNNAWMCNVEWHDWEPSVKKVRAALASGKEKSGG